MTLTPEKLAYLRADLIEHGTVYAEKADREQIARYLGEQNTFHAIITPSGAHGLRIELQNNARWCGTCKHDVPLSDFSSAKMKWCRACNREMVKRKYWTRQLREAGPSAVQAEITSLARRIAWLQNLLDGAK
jgi:hypothetical protein